MKILSMISLGLCFTIGILRELADDYLGFCETKGGRPSLTGFRNKLEAKREQEQRRQTNRQVRQDLDDSKNERLAAVAAMHQDIADRIDNQNFNFAMGKQ